jgi:hypothetical protein
VHNESAQPWAAAPDGARERAAGADAGEVGSDAESRGGQPPDIASSDAGV